MSRCARVVEAASWTLRAMDDGEATDYREHLSTCAICQAEVAELEMVAAALPLAAEQFAPPPELGDRIMATVSAAAQLQRAAAEPERAAVATAPEPRRRRGWLGAGWGRLSLAGATLAAVGIGIVAGIALDGGGTPTARTTRADAVAAGAHATFVISGTRAHLKLTGMPDPGPGKVYEVWIQRGNGPKATDALFSVNRKGAGEVTVPVAVRKGDQVMVTAEPLGGSAAPTSSPVVIAQA